MNETAMPLGEPLKRENVTYQMDRLDSLVDFQRQVFHDQAQLLNEHALTTSRWTLATCFLANAGAAGLAVGFDQLEPKTLALALNFWAQGAAFALASGPLSTAAATIAAGRFQHLAIKLPDARSPHEEGVWDRVQQTSAAGLGIAMLFASVIAFWRGASAIL